MVFATIIIMGLSLLLQKLRSNQFRQGEEHGYKSLNEIDLVT